MGKLKNTLLAIGFLAVVVPLFGTLFWWNAIRPFLQSSDIQRSAAQFERSIEERGGRHVLISSSLNIVDPASWGGIPVAIDGAIPLDGGLFLYIRWRLHGDFVQHAFTLPECAESTWTELGAEQWEAERKWLRRDVFGRPLPEAFEELRPHQVRLVIGGFDATDMTEKERTLVCDST